MAEFAVNQRIYIFIMRARKRNTKSKRLEDYRKITKAGANERVFDFGLERVYIVAGKAAR